MLLKIIRVGALDGEKLDIELSNGSLILLDLQPLLRERRFDVLLEDDRILYPKTDGNRIYWKNGPSITIDQLMKLVREP